MNEETRKYAARSGVPMGDYSPFEALELLKELIRQGATPRLADTLIDILDEPGTIFDCEYTWRLISKNYAKPLTKTGGYVEKDLVPVEIDGIVFKVDILRKKPDGYQVGSRIGSESDMYLQSKREVLLRHNRNERTDCVVKYQYIHFGQNVYYLYFK